MTANSLRDELMALPGVAEAEVDASGQSPSGVRVRLAADADAKLVGVEVQRVLASHGMRSRVASAPEDAVDDVAPEPSIDEIRHDQPAVAAAAAQVGEVIPLEPKPDAGEGILPVVDPVVEQTELPAVELEAPSNGNPIVAESTVDPAGNGHPVEPAPVIEQVPTVAPVTPDPAAIGETSALGDALVPSPLMAAPTPPEQAPPSTKGLIDLAALRLDETPEGVAVTATTTDGRTMTQRSGPTEEGLFEAIVAAVGALADGMAPELLSVERTAVNGDEVMTVIVARPDDRKAAGATVTRAGRAYAVARATWSALRS